MSQSPINDIPPELLCNVFDLLSFKDQLEAASTCRQWSEALSSRRYLKKQVLHISLYMTGVRHSEIPKHYPNIKIGQIPFVEKVRNFLLDDEVTQNLEELYLMCSSWQNEVFMEAITLNLPNLRRLSLNTFSPPLSKKLTIIAPNLKSVVFLGPDNFLTNPHREYMATSFLDQVEELIVRNDLSILQYPDRACPNLRRVSLISMSSYRILGQFFPRFIDQLTHLKLVVRCAAVEDILFNGTGRGSPARLESLQELSISPLDEEDALPSGTKLAVPNLKRLKANILRTPQFIVRNLRSLHVYIRTLDLEPYVEDIKTFLKGACSELQVLSIDCMQGSQSAFLAEQICAMTQLQALSLKYSTISAQNLRKIFTELRYLRRAWFVNCTVVDPEETTEPEQVFEALKAEFVDCAINVDTWGELD